MYTIPPIALDNIAFKSNGSPGQLASPVVSVPAFCADQVLPVTSRLAVANPQSGVVYRWFGSASPGAPLLYQGPAYDAQITGTGTYFYVRAVPAGAVACPSELTLVRPVFHALPVRPALGASGVLADVVVGNALEVDFAPEAGVTYTWNWGDGSPEETGSTLTHVYTRLSPAAGWPLTLTASKRVNGQLSCPVTYAWPVQVVRFLCEAELPFADRTRVSVRKDSRTGTYLFLVPGCAPAPQLAFDCLTGPAAAQGNVVATAAVELVPRPGTADPAYGVSALALARNPFLAGARRLAPRASYAYATRAVAAGARTSQQGQYSRPPFNWQVSGRHQLLAWQASGAATRFSPNGDAVEEQDVLGVFACTKLGYRVPGPGGAGLPLLPYVTAQNARYEQVFFEGCETYADLTPGGLLAASDEAFPQLAAQVSLETTYAHSGRQSFRLAAARTLTLPALPAGFAGQELRVWVRVSEAATPGRALGRALGRASLAGAGQALPLRVQWSPTGAASPLLVVAQSGEWLLCQASAPAAQSAADLGASPVLSYAAADGRTVWVDDLRLQPQRAQATCYVYEPRTQRLLASFDDQHFGVYYQYNPEGKLVRKLVETEKGVRTVQETQYNAPTL